MFWKEKTDHKTGVGQIGKYSRAETKNIWNIIETFI